MSAPALDVLRMPLSQSNMSRTEAHNLLPSQIYLSTRSSICLFIYSFIIVFIEYFLPGLVAGCILVKIVDKVTPLKGFAQNLRDAYTQVSRQVCDGIISAK